MVTGGCVLLNSPRSPSMGPQKWKIIKINSEIKKIDFLPNCCSWLARNYYQRMLKALKEWKNADGINTQDFIGDDEINAKRR